MDIYVFYCANCLDSDELRQHLGNYGNDEVITTSLPCSGKVNLLYLLKAFEKGADGVLLVTCEHGECKFLEGNLRAQKRSEAVGAMIEEIGLNRESMMVIQKNSAEHIVAAIEQMKKSVVQRSAP